MRTLRFDTDGDARWIDFDITVKATDGPVTFGDDKEGTFGVRVAQSMTVDAKQGGQDRQQPRAGRRRRVGASRTVGRLPRTGRRPNRGHCHLQSPQQLSISHVLARPDLRPVRRQSVRSCANSPHGKQADGAYTIPPGKSMTLRYRVFLHRGDEKEGKVAEAFAAYARGSKIGKPRWGGWFSGRRFRL